MAKTRDIRVIRTQTALLEALEEILKTKKLTNVTITELCSVASINRNTFYYHYNNIIDFLDEHKQIVLNDLDEIPDVSSTHNKDNLTKIIRCISHHPHFINIIISPNCDIDFSSQIFETASKKTSVFLTDNGKKQSSRYKMLVSFCNAGSNAVMIDWVANGMKEKPEEISTLIWDAAKLGIFPLMKPNGESTEFF